MLVQVLLKRADTFFSTLRHTIEEVNEATEEMVGQAVKLQEGVMGTGGEMDNIVKLSQEVFAHGVCLEKHTVVILIYNVGPGASDKWIVQ